METYEGLITSKVLPSTALTNLLLINNPVLRKLGDVPRKAKWGVRLLVRFAVGEFNLSK
jgi:hypothetical protein